MILIRTVEDIEKYLDMKIIIWGCGRRGQQLEIILKDKYP